MPPGAVLLGRNTDRSTENEHPNVFLKLGVHLAVSGILCCLTFHRQVSHREFVGHERPSSFHQRVEWRESITVSLLGSPGRARGRLRLDRQSPSMLGERAACFGAPIAVYNTVTGKGVNPAKRDAGREIRSPDDCSFVRFHST